MFSIKKKITVLILTAVSSLYIFSEDLPRGYKNITLGMSLSETKDSLVKDPDFGYHGDRDVSLIPNSSKVLIN